MVTSQPRCDRLGWDWFYTSKATHSIAIHIHSHPHGQMKVSFLLFKYVYFQSYINLKILPNDESVSRRMYSLRLFRLIHRRSRIRTISSEILGRRRPTVGVPQTSVYVYSLTHSLTKSTDDVVM